MENMETDLRYLKVWQIGIQSKWLQQHGDH